MLPEMKYSVERFQTVFIVVGPHSLGPDFGCSVLTRLGTGKLAPCDYVDLNVAMRHAEVWFDKQTAQTVANAWNKVDRSE
jgi:hypothetical protein